MTILPEPLEFEWDSGNSEKNYKKHGVTIREAEEAFINEPKFLFVDKKHSEKEKRYGLYGRTNLEKYISLVFTIRHNMLRIITVRPMSKKERSAYEKIKIDTSL